MDTYFPLLVGMAYAFLIAAAIYYYKLGKRSGLPQLYIIGLFLLKCILGVAYIELHISNYGGGDTLFYFNDSDIIFRTLFEDPKKYLMLTFGPNDLAVFPKFIEEEIYAMGFWQDTPAYMVVRFNALARLVSFGSIYAHVVFMAFFTTMAMTWLYRSFFRSGFTLWSVIFLLLPSLLFWTSGVHKEGLMLIALGMLFLGLQQLTEKQSWKPLLLFVAGAALLFLVRNYSFALLLPLLLAFSITYLLPKVPSLLVYLGVYGLIAGIGYIAFGDVGSFLISIVNEKQQAFQLLEAGGSYIDTPELGDSIFTFLMAIPIALKDSLLGPFLTGGSTGLYWLARIETIILLNLWVVLGGIAILRFPSSKHYSFGWVAFFLGFSLLVIIGLVVPNVGAILRYRSIALALITLAMLRPIILSQRELLDEN